MTSLTRERRATLEWAIEAAVEKGYTSDADVIRDLLSELLSASKPAAPEGWKLVPDHADADAIVTSLYRRFKDWSKRGFGPDDVTWCEVKADVLAMLAASPAAPAQSADLPSTTHKIQVDPSAAGYHINPPSEFACEVAKIANRASASPQSSQTAVVLDDERAAFEAWYAKVKITGDVAWMAWQARAAYTQPVKQIVDVSDLFADRATAIRIFDFYKKHALGSLAAPSCLCCGRSTQDIKVAIKHMELPDIVVCAECHRAASAQSCDCGPNCLDKGAIEGCRYAASPKPVVQPVDLDDERAAFEEHAKTLGLPLQGHGDGFYSNIRTRNYWLGWQARAAYTQPVAQPVEQTAPGFIASAKTISALSEALGAVRRYANDRVSNQMNRAVNMLLDELGQARAIIDSGRN